MVYTIIDLKKYKEIVSYEEFRNKVHDPFSAYEKVESLVTVGKLNRVNSEQDKGLIRRLLQTHERTSKDGKIIEILQQNYEETKDSASKHAPTPIRLVIPQDINIKQNINAQKINQLKESY